jgi:putative ABC transport system permease protein
MFSDLTSALRSWLKTPRLTVTLLACIAVSIGGTATVLTFVWSLLLRPLPFPAADRLVILNPLAVGGINQATRPYFSYLDFADLRTGASSYEMLEGSTVSRLVVQTGAGFERLRGETVTPGYFALFGLQPRLGRAFTAGEYAGTGERAIILSSRIWRTGFGADPAIVGRPIPTRAGPAVVVGIMPENYAGIAESDGTDYWLAEKQNNHPMMLTDRSYPSTLVFGRLKPGVTLATAAAETNGILAGLASAVPGSTPRTLSARLAPFGEQWRESLRGGLITLLIGSLFLLVIGCANVAILLLARLVGRERELAVRLALGATRGNLLRLLFSESLVLAVAGGGAGLLLAVWLNGIFTKLGGTDLPMQLPVGFSPAPVLLCLGVVLLTGFVFGLLPALVAARIDSSAALRTGGRGFAGGILQGRSGRLLVIGQTALAVTLLAGAALFLRSYEKLRYLDFGYRTDGLLRYQVSLQQENHRTPETQAAFFRNLDAELRALPGVRGLGFMGPTLPPYDPGETNLRLKGTDFATTDGALGVNWHAANNELFNILRVPLREGRWFGPEDRAGGQAVALVSETLAKRIAPDGSALGRTLLFNNSELVVVGVVADARWNGQRNRRPTHLNLFISHDQFPRLSVGLLLDCTVDPRALIEPVRRAVLARDSTAALHWIDTMEEALDYQTVNERFWTVLASAYAGTAFLLAVLGLYGVLAHGVASRVREIGIRMALGASADGVARMVVAQGLRLVVTGLAAGLGLTLLLGRWLEAKLYGTTAQDPVALGAVGLLLLSTALVVCWLPARRAAKTDPMIALRTE